MSVNFLNSLEWLLRGLTSNIVIGTRQGDFLTGSNTRNDILIGGRGDDLLKGLGGNDQLYGNAGDDRLEGGDGNDLLDGGSGDDELIGGAGNDILYGGSGDDYFDAGAGSDKAYGSTGKDVFVHRIGENIGFSDFYDGDGGSDTLVLELTRAEWMSSAVQSDIARFLVNAVQQTSFWFSLPNRFQFTATNLTVQSIENLKVFVDGVELDPRDQAVKAVNDSYTAQEGGGVTGQVLTNDSVPDLVKSVSLVNGPSAGTLNFNADGSFVYSAGTAFEWLRAGQTTTVSFTYKVVDADGDSDTAVATITIVGSNDTATISGNASGAIAEDSTSSVSGILTVQDIDQGENTFKAPTSAALTGLYGTFTFNNATGKWSYALDERAQQLTQGQTVVETLNVTSLDGTATKAITVKITGANDAAIITGQASGSVTEDVSVSTGGILSVSDVDRGENTFRVPTSAALVGLYGSFSFNATTGQWTYALDERAQKLTQCQTASETLTVTSLDGTATKTVTVNVTGTNDVAVISGQDFGTVIEDDTQATGGVLTVADVDTGEAAFRPVDPAALHGAYGSFTFNPSTGAWTYRLDDRAQTLTQGEFVTETLTVTSLDGTATKTIVANITGTNDAAVISGRDYGTISEDDTEATGGDLTIADIDASEAAFRPVDPAALHGAYGNFTFDPSTGAWTYQADERAQTLYQGEFVRETLTVTSLDGTATKTITATIIGTNDIAVIDGVSDGLISEDATGMIGGVLTVADVDAGQAGFRTVDSSALSGQYGAFTFDDAMGAWTYQVDQRAQALANGQFVTETLTVESTDGSASQTISVVVKGINDDPVLSVYYAPEDIHELPNGDANETSPGSYQRAEAYIYFKDVDLIDTHLVSIEPSEAGYLGEVTSVIFDTDNVQGKESQVILTVNNADIDHLAEGQKIDQTYVITITDGQGASFSQTVTFSIIGTNDAPVMTSTGQTRAVLEDVVVLTSGQITSTDVDDGATATYSGNATGVYGSLSINPQTGVWGYSLDPLKSQSLAEGETRTETFTVMVTDDKGATATQLVTIEITGTNDAPVITTYTASGSVTEDSDVITVGAIHASDIDNGDTVTYLGSMAGDYGDLTVDPVTGTWTYHLDSAKSQSLAEGETRTDTFTVTVMDHAGAMDTRPLSITIYGSNDNATISGNLLQSIGEDNAASIGGTLTVSDVDNGEAFFKAVAPDALEGHYGHFTFDAISDAWTYMLDSRAQALAAGQTANETLTVVSKDGTASEIIAVTITGANDTPVITSQVQSGMVREGASLTAHGTVTASDVDLGAMLAFSGSAAGSYGNFAVDTVTGDWIYTLNQSLASDLIDGETKVETFTVTVVDEHGSAASQDVTVTVTGTNHAPVITSGAQNGAVVEDQILTASGQIIAVDPDIGATLSYAGNAVGAYGSFAVNAGSGAWIYTINQAASQSLSAGEVKHETFQVTVTDNKGATAQQNVVVQITGTNDAPVILSGPIVPGVGKAIDLTFAGTPERVLLPNIPLANQSVITIEAWVKFDQGRSSAQDSMLFGNYVYDVIFRELGGNKVAIGLNTGFNDVFGVITEGLSGSWHHISVVMPNHNPVGAKIYIDGVAQTVSQINSTPYVPQANLANTAYIGGWGGNTSYGFDGSIDDFRIWQGERSAAQIQSDMNTKASGPQPGLIAAYDFENVTVGSAGIRDVSGNNYHGTLENPRGLLTVPGVGRAQTASVAENGGAVTIAASYTDIDANDTHVFTVNTTGTLGFVVNNADGTFSYNPNGAFETLAAGATATDTFTYTVTDSAGASASQTVVVTITGQNDLATIAGNASGSLSEDATTPIGGTLVVSDVDTGEAAFRAVDAAALNGVYGKFTFNTSTGAWTYQVDARAQALYSGQTGTETLVVSSKDGSAHQTITVTVDGANEAPSNISLSNLGSAGFRIDGGLAGDQSGYSVSSAGDVNGDGYDDVIIGTNSADPSGKVDAGASYLVFGKASVSNTVDLANLGSGGFRIDGALAGDLSGRSVASAGDFNGDGYADLIIAAPGADPYGKNIAGSSYILFGKASGFGTIDLANLGGSGLRIDGAAAGDYSGISVAQAGDINADGYDDVIIGASGANPSGKALAGSSYVVFGKASGFDTINLGSLGSAGFRIDGAAAYEQSGASVDSVGDMNGDGYDDIVIGALYADPSGKSWAGSAYVVFGKASGFTDINLANLSSAGFRINGAVANDRSGISVSSAGDVNGDGFDDLIVGAQFADPSGKQNAGSAYVIFGKASGFGTIDLANLGSAGVRLDGPLQLSQIGLSVSSAGDVNGDGYDDIILGAIGDNTYAGSSYVLFGKSSGFGAVDLSNLGASGFRIDGVAGYNYVGYSVAAAGDVNGDGFDDMIVGAIGADPSGKIDAGSSYVLYGSAFGASLASITLAGGAGAETLHGGIGNDVLSGDAGNDLLIGGNGNDRLIGGAGNDHIRLGGGNDVVVFNSAAEGVDRIDDFSHGHDKIEISAAGFGGGLTNGGTVAVLNTSDPLTASYNQMDGYFVFDTSGPDAGSLYWDATGGSASDAIKIAELSHVNLLQSSDFNIVA